MLERVTPTKTRFIVPGVALDARGILAGKLGVILFPALDGVVGWLRLYADEDTLDDLLVGMKISRSRTSLGSRAFLLEIPAATSYVLDRAARCARLAGGVAFTGSAKHFVRYRDEKSPCGYDVVDLAPAPAGADLVLHGDDGHVAYAIESRLDPAKLILRLAPRCVPGSEKLDVESRALLYLAVQPGLSPGLVRYLLRSRVEADLALVSVEKRSVFAGPGEGSYALFRVRTLPERLAGSLSGVPGLTIFKPAGETVAVELGYVHPINLGSVSSLFPAGKFHLLWGSRDVVDVLAEVPQWSSVRSLAEIDLSHVSSDRAATPIPSKDWRIGVDVKLVATTLPPRRVVGTLVPWSDADRLKKLVYLLPPTLLRGHQVALAERGILLLAGDGVDVVPLGTLLSEAAPGLLVPVGMELVPRVPNEILAAAIDPSQPEPGLTVFAHDGPPFLVPQSALAPLERRTLARVPVPASAIHDFSTKIPDEPPQVVNEKIGSFALWGSGRKRR